MCPSQNSDFDNPGFITEPKSRPTVITQVRAEGMVSQEVETIKAKG